MKALNTATATAHGGREGHVSVELEAYVDGRSTEETPVLMHAADEVCPSSNATRGNIDVRLSARRGAKA
jgi:organic hydroperoxide reductase OsmC/OhrA